jgi:P4 family phage/plasmid primase-like protien
MRYFESYGRRLLANGYLIVPIVPGQKRPALGQWQNARMTIDDISRYGGHGVGILHGQGDIPVVGIDIDTGNAQVAKALVAWCHKHIGYTPVRTGKAPKAMLYYRCRRGFRKWTSPWYIDKMGERHRIEILGEGQQSVVYAIHPDTKRPYEWDDLIGDGIADRHAGELPEFNETHWSEFVTTVSMVMEAHGLHASGPAPAAAVSSKDEAAEEFDVTVAPITGLTDEDILTYLSYLDNNDYHTWVEVGMALHHQFSGGDHGLGLWNQWSESGREYQGYDDLATKWATFRGKKANRTFRWVIKQSNRVRASTENIEREHMRAEFLRRIAEEVKNIGELTAVAREVGAGTTTEPLLRAELVAALHKRHGDLAHKHKVPVSEIRRLVEGEKVGGVKRDYTEVGNAQRLIDTHGKGLVYVRELDRWFRWTGMRWTEASHLDIEQLAQQTQRALFVEADQLNGDEKEAMMKFAFRSQTYAMVRAMCGLAKADSRILVGVDQLDAETHLFGVGNGVVDLRTGELLPPDPERLITLGTEVEYDPTAKAPLWEQTLYEVFDGDLDLMGFFHRLVGYMMLGDPTENVFVIPHGNGANGKSTVLGLIREAFGTYAKTAQSTTFVSEREFGSGAGAPREDILRLRKARLVNISEPEEGAHLRESLVKQSTGGEDRMAARGVHAKMTIEFKPSWVPVMATNHLPTVKGEDDGIWRRLLPIPFEVNFERTGRRDLDRPRRLKAELSGILAWCVRGVFEYRKHGLRPSTVVQESRQEYRETMDLLSEFIETRCEVGPTCRESTARLWVAWEVFARMRGELRLIPSAKGLGRRLRNRFKPAKWREDGVQTKGWMGIELRENVQELAD